mmetsp:Transcript_24275/g.68004  ORF Transcript_24275/g.68004 Transcript_24275/m.68004 type:complete len:602 (+) Transcript_24275:147-1952(+)
MDDKIEEWLRWDTNADDVKEIKDLVAKGDVGSLSKLFGGRIAFGTAGLRGRMGAGPTQMNDLIVQQTSQGLCNYLSQQPDFQDRGIVIGHDARHRSYDFACIAAAVFLSKGMRVFLYREIVPTPFVPFGVLFHKAIAGIMVTASHNPKDDNGYKLYWGNGCQIVSPHESNISDSIMGNLTPWEISDVVQQVKSRAHPKLSDTLDQVADAYFNIIKSPPYCYKAEDNPKANVGIVFSPMHGVGQKWVVRAFETFNLPPFTSVPEQCDPDPDFSTVTFPNPEEGKGVLALSIKAAEEHGCRVILANDPDSDRCAVAEKHPETGEWRTFTGDEIGAVLAVWCWKMLASTSEKDSWDASNYFMVTTAVSSKFLQKMAQIEGFQFYETLTGFKHIGNCVVNEIGNGKKFVFAYEDAIGYLPGDLSFDKDGVRTAAMMGELVSELYKKDETVAAYLAGIYDRYGHFATCNRYFFCYDPSVMKAIFDKFRERVQHRTFPTALGKYQLTNLRDLTVGYDSKQKDGVPVLPVSASSQMITLYFENVSGDDGEYNVVATIRGSGTEPKLKYYVEANGPTKAGASALAKDIVATLVAEILKPEENGLKPPVA